MPFEHGQLDELLIQVRSEGNPKLFMAPVSPLPERLALPVSWREVLEDEEAYRIAADRIWRPVQDVLPRIVAAIKNHLQGLGLLLTDSKEPSLVYLFTKQDGIYAHRGYLPTQTSLPWYSRLPRDLSRLYRVHNGWVDIFSGDTGPLPASDWKVLGASTERASDGFLEIFSTGGNGMGFDLEEDPPGCYIIWSDDEIEVVEDYWRRLDSWVAEGIEEMDNNGH